MYFDICDKLEENGFLTIPMEYTKNKPHYPKWSHLDRNAFPSKEEREGWEKKFGDDTNVSFLGDVTPAIDFDIEDAEIAEKMKVFVNNKFGTGRKNLFFRYGTRPKFLVPFQRGSEFKKLHTAKYTNDDGKACQIEVLGTGSSYTYYGTHRKSGDEYVEENAKGRKLKDVKLSSLPKLSKKDIVEIFNEFKRLISETNDWTSNGSASKLTNSANIIEEGKEHYDDEELKEMLMSIPYLGYNEWTSIGMALHNRFDGKSKGIGYWMEYSEAQCPDAFDPSEIEYKWSTFSNDKDEHITSSYITNLYHGIYGADADNDIIKLCKTIPEAIDRFYQIANTSEVFDSDLAGLSGVDGINVTARITKRAFLDTYSHVLIDRNVTKGGDVKTVTKSVAEWWCVQPARKTVQGVVFDPRKPKLYHANLGGKKAMFGNTFVSKSFELTKDNYLVHHLTDHLEYLIPNEKERTWMIQWMAWNIKHKGERCKVTPLLINTEHGSGRGWLVKLMETMLGSWNCSRPTIDQIGDKFHDFMIDKLLVSIEEVHQNKGKYELADNLKSILDADKYNANQKYGEMKERIKFCNFFFMSNRLDALSLEEDDRRLNVFFSRTERKPEAYYDNLYGLLEREDFQRQIYTFLTQTVDMKGFNPKGRSMDTEGRQILLKANKTEVDIVLDDFVKTMLEAGVKMIDQGTIIDILEEYSLPNTMIKTNIITHKMNDLMKAPMHVVTINGEKKKVWTYKQSMCDHEEESFKLERLHKIYISKTKHPITFVKNAEPVKESKLFFEQDSFFDL